MPPAGLRTDDRDCSRAFRSGTPGIHFSSWVLRKLFRIIFLLVLPTAKSVGAGFVPWKELQGNIENLRNMNVIRYSLKKAMSEEKNLRGRPKVI